MLRLQEQRELRLQHGAWYLSGSARAMSPRPRQCRQAQRSELWLLFFALKACTTHPPFLAGVALRKGDVSGLSAGLPNCSFVALIRCVAGLYQIHSKEAIGLCYVTCYQNAGSLI